MKLILITVLFQLLFGESPDRSNKIEDSGKSDTSRIISAKDTTNVFDSSKNKLSDKEITISFSYAAIACGCPQWFETKYRNVKFLKGVERFYLEPTDTSLLNANKVWDGEHLPLTLKVTGKFSNKKELPRTYNIKGEPEKARIFWYTKIRIDSPASK